MTNPLPFATGTIYGTFAEDIIDEDTGGHLSGAPLQNVRVTFTPNISPNFIQNIYGIPKTYVIEPVHAVTNALGQLVVVEPNTPVNALQPGVQLIASIDDNINPSGWTWTAELNAPNLPTMTIDFTLSKDQEVDLARVTPIPPDLDGALAQWQLAIAAATEAVEEAETLAAQAGQSASAAAQYATNAATKTAEAAASALSANAAKTSAQFASTTAEIYKHNAEVAAQNAADARDRIEQLSDEVDQSIGIGYQRLEEHRVSAIPHPAYDDMTSLKLIFENKLI